MYAKDIRFNFFFNVISEDSEQSWLCNRWVWKWIRLIRIANKETMISCIKKKLKWLNRPCKFTCFWFSSLYLLLLQYKPCKFCWLNRLMNPVSSLGSCMIKFNISFPLSLPHLFCSSFVVIGRFCRLIPCFSFQFQYLRWYQSD